MLVVGDKIEVLRNGVFCYTDTVLSIKNGIAHTKNGKRFAYKCKVLKPLRGLKDYNYQYRKIT